MNQARCGPFFNRSMSKGFQDHNASILADITQNSNEKPSFSSLFTSLSNNNNSIIQKQPTFEPFSESCANIDDGIFLQISNLDQWYDESDLRNYLMSQLKPITPILSLNIETPSIAKVKVPSIQVRKSFPSPCFGHAGF